MKHLYKAQIANFLIIGQLVIALTGCTAMALNRNGQVVPSSNLKVDNEAMEKSLDQRSIERINNHNDSSKPESMVDGAAWVENQRLEYKKYAGINKPEDCDNKYPWSVGLVRERVACLNRFVVLSGVTNCSPIKGFKEYRVELSRLVDQGIIDASEFSRREKSALDEAESKCSAEKKESEERYAKNMAKGHGQKPPSDAEVAELHRIAEQYAASKRGNGQGDSAAADPDSALVAVLGVAARLALMAAPYALGYAAGNSNAAAWANYYNRQPRIMTCIPVGGNVSSCH